MEIKGFENLPKLFISQTEKMMDEFIGSVKELRGLFKIPKSMFKLKNLHQQICNTAKRQFEETNGDCCLWFCNSQKTIEGMLSINTMEKNSTF